MWDNGQQFFFSMRNIVNCIASFIKKPNDSVKLYLTLFVLVKGKGLKLYSSIVHWVKGKRAKVQLDYFQGYIENLHTRSPSLKHRAPLGRARDHITFAHLMPAICGQGAAIFGSVKHKVPTKLRERFLFISPISTDSFVLEEVYVGVQSAVLDTSETQPYTHRDK